MEDLHVPGMVVAVTTGDGTLLLHASGSRHLERDLPVASDTRFYIASATKPFVALAVGLLAAEGSVDLDRPVRTYLPRFELADATETRTITVRDLLAHRHGLESYPITFGEAFTGQMTEDRYYRLLSRVRGVGELDYSNLHYTLLGRVIEAVSGRGWKEVVEAEVLRPAGMDRSTTRARPLAEDPNAAVPYEFVDGEFEVVSVRKTERTMHAAGGMVSTARDLVRWIRIHLGDGLLDGERIFPADAIREMRLLQIEEEDPHPFVPGHRRLGWGLGWDVRDHRGARLFHHGGRFEGWATHMSFMPAADVGVVVLANVRDGAAPFSEIVAVDIYDRLLGLEPRDLLPRLVAMVEEPGDEGAAGAPEGPREPTGPTLAAERYVGRYCDPDWGTLEVRLEGRRLRARIGDLSLPMVWTEEDEFVADEDHPGRFELPADGRATAVFLGGLRSDAERVEFVRCDEDAPSRGAPETPRPVP